MKLEDYILSNELSDRDESDIASFVWWNDERLSIEQKFDFSILLFERNPMYKITAELNMNFSKMSDAVKDQMWNFYRNHLTSEKTVHRDQIEYSLWVDFFEDSTTVEEAWKQLVGNYENENILKRLLSISGPVPFPLKEVLYKKVIHDEEFHPYILDSIGRSFFDVCGEIEIEKAREILKTLVVDKTTEKYTMINTYLKKFDSKEEYWQSIKS